MKRVSLLPILVISFITGFSQNQENVITVDIGNFKISTLSEVQQKGNSSILIDVSAEILAKYAPDGTFPNAINAFLVQIPDKNILVDAGLGTKLIENLQSLGITPEKIDVVLITHMHGDHIGGMLKDEKLVFENADVYVAQIEYDYWMDSSNVRGVLARNVMTAYKDKLHLFTPAEIGTQADDLISGFKAFAAYGHTPGHTIFLFESDNSRMLIWGDLTHAMAVQIPYPEIAVTYDVDPKQAIASRKKVLDYVVKNKIPIAGMHIAFPAIGDVTADSNTGYKFTPHK
ncbi:MAG: MBL fold metallo-hydrolase [Prevotellaceae bacterium]|jgi:glyoxylase-like metal-dependent hydrolase (beta-lactamase superfamily II)|nr:MBL fold metallo-hydrolase [Prevotellaceae bacterium]